MHMFGHTVNRMFSINVRELHIHIAGLGEIQMEELRHSFTHVKETIMTTQAETAQALRDVNTTLTKAAAEIVAKVTALEEAVAAAGATTPEVEAAVADLRTAADALDALNPDTPAPV